LLGAVKPLAEKEKKRKLYNLAAGPGFEPVAIAPQKPSVSGVRFAHWFPRREDTQITFHPDPQLKKPSVSYVSRRFQLLLPISYFPRRGEKATPLAAGPGFEPGLMGSEPIVLPLDDPAIFQIKSSNIF
jgi:hypothetical protein